MFELIPNAMRSLQWFGSKNGQQFFNEMRRYFPNTKDALFNKDQLFFWRKILKWSI